jgi:Spy/CpxP family protein refolding chaperone
MITLRHIVPALCLATSLSGVAVYAQTTASTTPETTTAGHGHWNHGHGGLGSMGFVLHKLNLTADQKTQIKAIFAGQKSQFEALRASEKSNRQALATTAPTDPGYPALIETAKSNAATRITLASQTWSQIYASVLTKEQQAQIPAIVAAAQAARASKVAAWKAQHPQP